MELKKYNMLIDNFYGDNYISSEEDKDGEWYRVEDVQEVLKELETKVTEKDKGRKALLTGIGGAENE